MVGGGKKQRAAPVLLGGGAGALESEGASAPVGHWPPNSHLSANFFYPFTLSPSHHCLYLLCAFREFYYDLQTAFYT